MEDDFPSIVASYKQNAGPDRPGKLFDQIAVPFPSSDFLFILDNVVTKEFRFLLCPFMMGDIRLWCLSESVCLSACVSDPSHQGIMIIRVTSWTSGRLSRGDARLACKHNFYIMPL